MLFEHFPKGLDYPLGAAQCLQATCSLISQPMFLFKQLALLESRGRTQKHVMGAKVRVLFRNLDDS
jgi:hypothetical protein